VITVGAADGCQVTCVTWCSGAVFVTGVCVCHMVLLPQVCLCITGVCVSQASFHAVFVTGLPVSLFVARMRACAEARLGAVGRGSRHALCWWYSTCCNDLLQLRPCRITLAFTSWMAHDGIDGWCAGGIDGRIRLWDIRQVSSPVGGRCECRVWRVGCVKHGMRCREVEAELHAVLTTPLAPARL
jgi:hypothetical protein